ncbi:YcaO-like family protein [Pseudomonas oryzicola]|uniref:YcaO-like family protein n=1 Tax=Pseudomonas oryzicola TaxID=485876 RepID=A0ABS6QA86_9PSED|nr:YcaO-like family protein [Pseudomonas oryzicola]MBV4491080.1 YcaO-like family protein [Pseudomonas oryzicola]
MNTLNEVHTPNHADFVFHRPNAVAHFPHSIECATRWQTYGSSSGWSTVLANSALGEHFERKHFYLDIPTHKLSTLDLELTPEECDAFYTAFTQTSSTYTHDDLKTLQLSFTNAYRLTNFTACRIPTACISILPSENPTDNLIYPMRDTCGCSAHVTLEHSITGALKESLERQFLLRFWLTGVCTESLEFEQGYAALRNSASLQLFRELKKSGKLTILNLTDNNSPGSCILLYYGNDNNQRQPVQYCAGMAYAKNTSDALEKATIELWQTFRFMHSLYNEPFKTDNIEDPYLRHFINCNQYDTYQNITNIAKQETRNTAQLNPTEFNLNNIISAINRQNLDGYLYVSQSNFNKSTLYFCKYVSPNLFLHMNNASHFNLRNRYSQSFENSILPKQLNKMVPFP